MGQQVLPGCSKLFPKTDTSVEFDGAELKAIGKDLFVDYWENVPLKSDPIRPNIL